MMRSPEFQRRIDDAIEDGWEVEESSPGRVVLRKPDYGDVGIHILLFVFTAGIGNLVYGAHCYFNHPRRKVLREDDVEDEDALDSLSIERELDTLRGEGSSGKTASTNDRPEQFTLEDIKLQYARGEIDDAEFESLLERYVSGPESGQGERADRALERDVE